MRARHLIWLLLLAPFAFLAYCATHIPGGPDVDVANQVGDYIASGYGQFANRGDVERTGQGKIYYASPGSSRTPTIIIYEVTAPSEVIRIEALAREALQVIPDANGVDLHFHERQNLTLLPGGGSSRGWETPFKKVRISR